MTEDGNRIDTRSKEGMIELIKLLIAKPAIFGIDRVEDIDLVIKGYSHKSHNQEIKDFLISFNVFVNESRFKEHNDLMKFEWSKVIRLYSSSNKHSIELFSFLFEQFLSG